MVNLLNSNVMFGLISAASHTKMSEFCTEMYNTAKSRGDEAAMDRAMGYASQYRDKAMTAKEQTGEALIESAKEARLEEKLEQEQRIEEKRIERQSEAEALQENNSSTETASLNPQQPAYILDLSQDYLDSVHAGTVTESDVAFITTATEQYPNATDIPSSAGVVYSPSNPIDFQNTKISAANLCSGTGTVIDLQI